MCIRDRDKLAQTPAAALGSCRFKLAGPEEDTAQYRVLIDIFRKYDISYFIYIGGNDSMDTVDKLARYCRSQQIEDIKIIGAPKTIDNDLMEIDHCPGFASAAKYIATTFAELERDVAVYDSFGVTIVEIMGRNAGWLTAASSLSRVNGNRGPDFIYLCDCLLYTSGKPHPHSLRRQRESPKRSGADCATGCRRPLYWTQCLGRLSVQPHHTPGHAFIHE